MWWLTTRMLCSDSPRAEAWAVAEALDQDPTPRAVATALPDEAVTVVLGWPEVCAGALHRRGDLRVRVIDAMGEGSQLADVLAEGGLDALDVPEPGVAAATADADLVLLEALAVGPTGAVAISGSRAAAAVARHAGVPVWLVAGAGRVLPGPLWEALLGRLDLRGDPWDADEEVVPLDLVDRVIGPWGEADPGEAVARTDCPVAAELFKGVYAPGTHVRPDRHRRWR